MSTSSPRLRSRSLQAKPSAGSHRNGGSGYKALPPPPSTSSSSANSSTSSSPSKGVKPPPPPKPKITKHLSSPLVSDGSPASTKPMIAKEEAAPSGSYFQGLGGSNFGYCLPAVYRSKVNPNSGAPRRLKSDGDDSLSIGELGGGGNEGIEGGGSPSASIARPRPKFSKPNFGLADKPSFSALPEKFRMSFEERSRGNLYLPTNAGTSSEEKLLTSSSEFEDAEVKRRFLATTPRNNPNRLSAPLPITTAHSVTKSLPTTTSVNFQLFAPTLEGKSTSSSNPESPLSSHASISSPTTSIGSINAPIPSEKRSSITQPVTFARPPPRKLQYTEREHFKKVFGYLDKMRKKGELCDVTLIANQKEIKAHKAVLAAASSYFESMFVGEFSEPEGEPIYIEEVDEDTLVAMVDFAYTARIKLTDQNVYFIFEAADLFQFSGLRAACFKFFKQQMNQSNCIRTWLFAESHNCTELLDAALKFVECNFPDIVHGREFLEIEQADIISKLVSLEDIAITSEEQVYEAVLRWIHYDMNKRKEVAVEVFKNVRFPSMSRDYLMYIVDNEELIKEDPDLLQQLIDALESHVSTIRATLRRKLIKEGGHSGLIPRAASMAVEIVQVYRENTVLGLRVMGGADRPKHIFRQGDRPGIFILEVLPDGAAALCGKLKSGDRILKVNDEDVSTASHDQAIRLLKISPDPLTLLVRHEHPPAGLLELTLVTKPGEGFGFSISGGVNGYPGNLLDETDEGIFISEVIQGGAAHLDGRLHVGMRILQINSASMHGKTYDEALHVVQGVLDRMNLLVCFGYDPKSLPPEGEGELEESEDEQESNSSR